MIVIVLDSPPPVTRMQSARHLNPQYRHGLTLNWTCAETMRAHRTTEYLLLSADAIASAQLGHEP